MEEYENLESNYGFFIDDLSIAIYAKRTDKRIKATQVIPNKVYRYFDDNNLKRNASKTQVLCIRHENVALPESVTRELATLRNRELQVISLLIITEEITSCPRQNVDIHDFLKQKQLLKDAPDILSCQPMKSLIPVHHQIHQKSQSIKEFMLLVVLTNKASFICMFSIFWIRRCGITYTISVTRELETLWNREHQDTAPNP